MWDRLYRHQVDIGMPRFCMDGYVRKIESIIDVHWGQENPNPRVHRYSGKRGFHSVKLYVAVYTPKTDEFENVEDF